MVQQDDRIIHMLCTIVGVVSSTKFLSCVSCAAKVTQTNIGIGQCEKCLLKQKLGRCKESNTAKVLIENADSKEVKTVTFQ